MKHHTDDILQGKLSDMYPEISEKNVSLDVNYEEGKKSWIVKLTKDGQEHVINLPEADADMCITGKYCEPFSTELKDVLNRFEGK